MSRLEEIFRMPSVSTISCVWLLFTFAKEYLQYVNSFVIPSKPKVSLIFKTTGAASESTLYDIKMHR